MSSSEPRLDVPEQFSAEQLYEVNEVACSFYEDIFWSEEGQRAQEHVFQHRQLPEWIAREENLGYVGGGKKRFVEWASQQDLNLEVTAEAGLVYRSSWYARQEFQERIGRAPTSDEELTDFFLNNLSGDPKYYSDYPLCHTADGQRKAGFWLVLPIRVEDEQDQTRIGGFQYRSMRPAEEIGKRGRYMSPRNTQAIQWSETLIGLAEERDQINRSGNVVITEGKFDQLAVKAAVRDWPEQHRPGTIALGGASIRGVRRGAETPEEQAGILADIRAGRATFFLDDDERGQEAIIEAGPLLANLGTHVQVAQIPDGEWGDNPPEDPGELLEEGGVEAVRTALKNSRGQGLISYASRLMAQRLSESSRSGQLRERMAALDVLVPILKSLPEPVQKRAAQSVADVVDMDPQIVGLALQQQDQQEIRPPKKARQGLVQPR